MKFLDRLAARFGFMRSAKSWDKLWLRAIESTLLGNKVTKPYSQHWAVYLAISKIATNIAQTPFSLYRGDEQVWEHPVIDLLNRPNPQLSGFQIWEATAIFLNLRGECFWILDESMGMAAGLAGSVPSAIWVFNPDRFKPAVDASGNLVGWTYKQVALRPDEVIHFKFFNPYDDIRGLSPLEAARISMETDYRAIKYNEAFFKNSAVPEIGLVVPGALSDEQFNRLLAQWESRHKGESKAHRIALLEGGLDVKQLGLKHKDMDFLEQRKFSLEEILGVFGVPKAIALTSDLRYATAMVQRKAFWNDTLLPQMALIAGKLQADFFPRFAPEFAGWFDTDQVEELREDLKNKTEVAHKLWQMGFTANEINDRLDLGFAPKPWRDLWWVGINLVPVELGMTPPEERSTGGRQLPAGGEIKQLEEPRREAYRRRFLLKQQVLEKQFQSKIKRYFFEQRQRVLEILSEVESRESDSGGRKQKQEDLATELVAQIAMIWADEGERLVFMARPLYGQAATAGGELALDVLDLGISFDLQKPEVLEIISRRLNRIKNINNTIWQDLRDEIREGLAEGEAVAQVAERVRHVYNVAANRSLTIGRTETASCMNEASFNEYKAHGVRMKRWITAHDEAVRGSHLAAQAQGAIPIAQAFNNGLMYPGDPDGDAAEVINCRCTPIPEMEV